MKKWMFGAVPILAAAVMAALFYVGRFQLNRPAAEAFPVRGVDVSHYQGNIDWHELQAQGIMFAYIKATEGSSHQDSMFRQNWQNIAQTSLRAGAYHFFSFESPGLNQAENFIATVPAAHNMLPPALDVEPYGQFKRLSDFPGAASEIRDWLNAVQAAYGVKPVIYTTQALYRDLIAPEFPDHAVWIRSVYTQPSSSVPWTFWQYSSRAHLQGYDGEEYFIDMNAFNGTTVEFEAFGH